MNPRNKPNGSGCATTRAVKRKGPRRKGSNSTRVSVGRPGGKAGNATVETVAARGLIDGKGTNRKRSVSHRLRSQPAIREGGRTLSCGGAIFVLSDSLMAGAGGRVGAFTVFDRNPLCLPT